MRNIVIGTLGAIAFIVAGCTRDITPASPDVDTQVTILAPTENQTLDGSDALVILSADENLVLAKIELYLDASPQPVATLTTQPWIFSLPLGGLSDGVHSIQVKSYDPGGTMTESEVRRFVRQASSSPRDQRMLLVENFTNTGCVPCKGAEEDYERILQNEAIASRVGTILYHVFWPDPKDPFYLANKAPVQARVQYDSVISAPHVRFNGFLRGEAVGNLYRLWLGHMINELNRPPEIGIRLSKQSNGNDIIITADITPYAESFPLDLKYYLVITEDSVHYEGSNGIKIHNFAMREMITGGLGEPVAIMRDQPLSITKSYTLNPDWVREQLHAVAFVQSHSSKMVLQAAKVRLD